jgi:peptidoglycan hydrolase CwlO-like protein
VHTKSCTRANSARSAVKELVGNQLGEIGRAIHEHEKELREGYDKSLGIDALYKKIEHLRAQAVKLTKQRDDKVKAEMKQFESGLQKRRDRLCAMRSEVLFAKTERLRAMYGELEQK